MSRYPAQVWQFQVNAPMAVAKARKERLGGFTSPLSAGEQKEMAYGEAKDMWRC